MKILNQTGFSLSTINGIRVIKPALFLFLFLSNISWSQTISSSLVQVSMLEVYTSQGCSSCPPAERWMSKFKQDKRLWKQLVPMNFHVDYWDYLGWKDPYASSIFTKRQRDYKALKLSHTVATPGFIVSGQGWNGWFRGQLVPAYPFKAVGVLSAKVEEMQAQISFNPVIKVSAPLTIHVAILGFDQITNVQRGENSGKQLPHDFVVMAYNNAQLTLQKGSYTNHLTLPDASQFTSANQALVFWVSQQKDPSPIQVAADWWNG